MLERTETFWRADASRPVEADERGAEVGAAAGAVGTAHDIVQIASAPECVRDLIGTTGSVAGNRIDCSDNGSRERSAAYLEPPALALEREAVVDGRAGIGIGDRRDIGDGALRARVGLPYLLTLIQAAPTPRPCPCDFRIV